jgi:hypothetical protein
MAKTIDPDLTAALREESERSKDLPYPPGARFTHPNRDRSRVYSIRLSPQEYDSLQALADRQHLPASTLVRSWILERLEQDQSA